MRITEKSFIFNTSLSVSVSSTCLFVNRRFVAMSAKKRDDGKGPIFPPKVSSSLLTEAAIAVFGLGFIDAGYSGDWSRIGVISKEIEDLLKLGAFLVVPLCMFLILSISKKQDS